MSNRIREIRKSKGITLVQLAARCGLSHSAINYLERGMKTPRSYNAEAIAKALGQPMSSVFPANGFDRRAAGAKGGKIAAARMTPEARKARARKAVSARWSKGLNARLSELI